VVEGGQVFWLHWDHILRPVLATDATGAVVWAARYLPFGGIDAVSVDTGALSQNIRFPGQWFQAETGLYQNWMRDYDPTTGRYLEADPLGLVDGPSVYGYARQSPVRYVDPRGEDACYTDQRTGERVCRRSSDTYCPSGDCAWRDSIENNTEFAQCMEQCSLEETDWKATAGICGLGGRAVGMISKSTTVGRGAALACNYVGYRLNCSTKCRRTCGLN
jgi:RHS repeat-associated protein